MPINAPKTPPAGSLDVAWMSARPDMHLGTGVLYGSTAFTRVVASILRRGHAVFPDSSRYSSEIQSLIKKKTLNKTVSSSRLKLWKM